MKNYIKRYIKQPRQYLRDIRKRVVLAKSASAVGCAFEGRNKVYAEANLTNSTVGRGTYIAPYAHLPNTRIGRYCSIGQAVMVVAGRHPLSEMVSTHPAFYSTRQQAGFTYVTQDIFPEYVYSEPSQTYYVTIGSDVWIGARAMILGGVTIDHGAVIAAGSIVTKDVPAYSIVAGVPARIIRHRFPTSAINKQLEDPWWDKPEQWIISNLPKLQSPPQ